MPVAAETITWVAPFREKIYRYYDASGRTLPWRTNPSPYAVCVSEAMLQQTQVERVIPKYRAFIREFPGFLALARADLAAVLRVWSGLGYPRRAQNLKRTAEIVVEEHARRLPKEREVLLSLPGIGQYTASAIRVFAFDKPEIVIETNIRAVFSHEFFSHLSSSKEAFLTDNDLIPYIEASLDYDAPRRWYSALMDYGAALKREGYRSNHSFVGYRKQAPYKGSKREMRGRVLSLLNAHDRVSEQAMMKSLKEIFPGVHKRVLDEVLSGLCAEKLVSVRGGKYVLGS